MQRHPVFPERTQAKVRVVLRETAQHGRFDHDLTLKVWVDTAPGVGPEALRSALLRRANEILQRCFAIPEPTPILPPLTPRPGGSFQLRIPGA